MKVSDLFIKCLENEGVKYIFGVPGEEILDLMDSLLSSSIKFIPTRHEQGAAFMADVYGRLTGKAGVCLATLGPGATNLTTGVADANLDRAPLVAITGQSDLKKIHKESHQYIDIVQNFSPITKWNARITHGDVVPEVVRKAFLIAQTEKPGATHIEIAENIAKSESHNKPLKVTPNPRFHPDHEDIEIASKLIKNSNYPIILGGNGIIRGRASKELIEFAKKNNIPVANTFMGKGIIPSNHRLYLSTVGLQAKDHVMCGFDLADLVITIGYDMVEYAPSFWNSLADKKIIHIDTQRSEVDTYYVPDIELIGDIKSTLKILIEKTGFKKDVEYIHYLKKTIEKEFEELKDDVSFPIKPQKVLYDIRQALSEDDILISDVGAHKMWIARMFPAYKPNTVILSNGFASMGIAVPGAIAAKLAEPEKKIIAATGDGGFLMNSQEIETAKRLGLNFVVLIFKDSSYGMIKWRQMNKFKRESGVAFTNPDFAKYAESFGAKGYIVESARELLPILKEALSIDDIAIVDVEVDYLENLRLTENLGKHICPI